MSRTWVGALYAYGQRLLQARAWIRQGRKGSPPHLIKQRTIRKYKRQFHCDVLVETGTYEGDMIHALRRDFAIIHSIELGKDLFARAKLRFAGDPYIFLHQGSSGEVLGNLLQDLHQPCLFWLDAHYSAGITAKGDSNTPIEEELKHIFAHACALRHVILIDDARCFVGQEGYPTIVVVATLARQAGYTSFQVEDDIIRICNRL